MDNRDHINDEQIRIWSEELLDAVTLGGQAFRPADYEEVIQIHQAADRAVRYLISRIYGKPTK